MNKLQTKNPRRTINMAAMALSALLLGLLPGMSLTAYAALESYLDASGIEQDIPGYCEHMPTDGTWGTNGQVKWYDLHNTYYLSSSTVTVNGEVNLILRDGKELTVNNIIVEKDSTLNIYAQSTGANMGKLEALGGSSYCAGIGSSYDPNETPGYEGTCGTITINGGTVTAKGGTYGAGIGGGWHDRGGTITINGGIVTATGGQYAAGIGGGASGRGAEVTINGGTVEASGYYSSVDNSVGIGGGVGGVNHGTLTLGEGVKLYGDDGIMPDGSGTPLAEGPVEDVTTRYVHMKTTYTAPTLATGHAVWAENNGIAGAWNEKDASGIYNVFRYVFDVPSGAFEETPLIDIAFEDGKVVVKTPPVVNSAGVTISVVESSDVAGETVTATKAVDASGITEFAKDSAAESRFYRLKADVTE